MSASEYLKNPLVLALLGGAGYLVYKKYHGATAANSEDDDGADAGADADADADAAADEEDADEDDELAALNPKNRPGGGRLAILRGVRMVGPLTRKIRNKKRKLMILSRLGPILEQTPENQEKYARLRADLAHLMAERDLKISAKKGEAYTIAKNKKRAEKLKAMMASGKYPQAYIEALAGTITVMVPGNYSVESNEDANVQAIVEDMSDEEVAQAQQVANEMSALANRSLFSFYR